MTRKTKGIFFSLFWPNAIAGLAFIILLSTITSIFLVNRYESTIFDSLESKARIVQARYAKLLKSESVWELRQDVLQAGTGSQTRITVIGTDGNVISDSQADPGQMENHKTRPEFESAMSGQTGKDIRSSYTLGKDMAYLAVPLLINGKIIGVLRFSQSLYSMESLILVVFVFFIACYLIFFLALFLISRTTSLKITGTLMQISGKIKEMAEEGGKSKLYIDAPAEFEMLSGAVNTAVETIQTMVNSANAGTAQQEAILSSMMEGVLAIDSSERIIRIYKNAAVLLGVDEKQAGKSIHEAIRNSSLIKIVRKTLVSDSPVEEDFVLSGADGEKYIMATGTTIKDRNSKVLGAVIVLSDVTKLRMFERMRKEFVANVSHELRTPVTSIKGSVETLLDGAIDYPNDARKFLGIIAGQAERLGSIINDLMSLSRIEQEEEKGLIQMEPHNLKTIALNALEDVQMKAKERLIQIDLVCERDITATANDRLLEQAIVNLIDNAINYSDPGSKVIVELSQSDGETMISVRDNGIGISKEHIPRLFERFYRVDRGRSRKQGGTGLGLAIVKHIVNAHGGHMTVESVLGAGSTFTMHIPERPGH